MTDENEKKGKSKKKLVLAFCFFLICIIIVIFIGTKSSYFEIKTVIVKDNLFVTKDEITLLANIRGENIFLLDKNKIEQRVTSNPYIEKISIKRKLPSTAIIEVTEKKIRGVVKFQNGLINIDSEGKMVQLVSTFPNGKIPMIIGVKVSQYKPNEELIKNDKDRLIALKSAMTISDYNESRYVFNSINISDPFNIVLIANDGHVVKIGDWTNMQYKIAYAVSILKSSSIKGLNGFIQIQSDGNAIFKKN